ncbi:MAG: DUF58 domain-containing protein [Candidatus Doudnabacteria bacterium]
MELKSGALGITGASIALLVLGAFTGGRFFFAFGAAGLAIVAADGLYYLWQAADLERNLRVRRSLSRSELLLGSRLHITYRLDYAGRKGRRLQIEQPASRFLMDGEPRRTFRMRPGTSELTFTVMPVRRGTHIVDGLRMATESLLFRSTVVACGNEQVLVYTMIGRTPARASDPGALPIYILAQRTQSCFGPDFCGMRDFFPGCNIKHIDWARSARSGTLVAKKFEDTCPLPLFLLLDVDASMETGKPKTELDSAVKLATMLAVSAMQDDEHVGLACFSRSGITVWLPPAGGQEHTARLRKILASAMGVKDIKTPRASEASIRQASAALQVLGKGAGPVAANAVIEEAIGRFMFNVREDGFIKAISQAAQSAGAPCNIAVITNLSMGIDSLASGARIARYSGHHVSVILTPHIWYDSGEGAGAGVALQPYCESRDAMKRLRSMGMQVIEPSAVDAQAEVLTPGKLRNIKKRGWPVCQTMLY